MPELGQSSRVDHSLGDDATRGVSEHEGREWRALMLALSLALSAVLGAIVLLTGQPAALLLAAVVAAPLAALLLVALARRPQHGVLLLAALVPFDGLQKVVTFPAGWKEALTLAVLAATFVAPRSARAPRRPAPQWAFVLGALVVLAGISALVVGGTQGLVGMKVGFFYVLLAVSVWRCPLDARERDRLVTILMVTGFVVAVFGLVQQVLGEERLVQWGWEYDAEVRTTGGYLRSFSTFATPFAFALYLMLVLLVGLTVGLADLRRRRNQLFLLSVPVFLGAMALTVTRVAWLGLGAGIVYLAVTRFRSLRVVLVDGLVIAVVFFVVASSFGGVFLSRASSEERFDIWGENISDIAAHPFGAGIGASGSAAEKTAELAEEDTGVFQPDNYYFKMAFELGIIGLWLFVLLLVAAGTSAHRTARTLSGTDAALASGVAASVLAAAFGSVVSTYFEIFPLDAYFWMLLAVVATCRPGSR